MIKRRSANHSWWPSSKAAPSVSRKPLTRPMQYRFASITYMRRGGGNEDAIAFCTATLDMYTYSVVACPIGHLETFAATRNKRCIQKRYEVTNLSHDRRGEFVSCSMAFMAADAFGDGFCCSPNWTGSKLSCTVLVCSIQV